MSIMPYLVLGKKDYTKKEMREIRKRYAQSKVGRPSNARRFGSEVYRLHNVKGSSKGEAKQTAINLRNNGYRVRVISPPIVGDRLNIWKRRYWIYKKKR